VVMIHGFTGSPASMRPIGEWLAAQGISALGVRLPGHGTAPEDLAASRWTDWVAEADRELSAMRGRCERVVLFAQSMGAAVALLVGSRRPTDVDGIALVNPYVRDRRLLLLPVGRLFLSSVKGVGSDIRKAGVTEDTYERIPLRSIEQLRDLLRAADRELRFVTAPLLVFRSLIDHVIPRGNARRILDRVRSPWTEVVVCPNSYHVVTLDLDAPMVRERLLDFVKSL
jgi:carboxylesterase